MKIAFKTFGCKANMTDTDALFLEAEKRGFTVVDETSVADAYVINTCTVTENADKDARQQANRYKRANPESVVALVGCYAQVATDELVKLPQVDLVVGTANKFRALDHIKQKLNSVPLEKNQVEKTMGFLPEHFPGSKNSRATIKIQDGCNFKCTFCIIPEARGKSRSLPLETIVKQVNDAYQEGFQEVILTGIHLAHYGWDHNTDLVTLVRALLSTPEGPRVRLSSLDPFEIPHELIEMLKTEKRLCPHFHIALQSGSDKILARMKRFYKAQEFVDVCNKIQSVNPDTFIGVDVIVGFPGETEEDFQETVETLKKSFWSKLHVFSYSVRKGTPAAAFEDHVKLEEIARRSEVLRMLSEERHIEFLKSQVGKEKAVLLERPSKKHPGFWLGHTENYLPTLSKLENGEAKAVFTMKLGKISGEKITTISC